MNDFSWSTLGTSETLITARYRFPGGRSRTTLVALEGNRWIAFSPGAELSSSAAEYIDDDAELFLVAPASSHLMGLDAWMTQFKRAKVVASSETKTRILKKTAVREVLPPGFLDPILPPSVNIHPVASSVLGEIWLSVREGGRFYWLVCDAFMNIDKLPDAWLIRMLMKLYGLQEGLSVSRGFARRGVSVPRDFRDWAMGIFAETSEHALVPCHGLIDEEPELGKRMRSLISQRFGES